MTDAPERESAYQAYINEVMPNGNTRLTNIILSNAGDRAEQHIATQIDLAFQAGWSARADLATPAPAVKVKALVWEDHPACDGPVIARAVTLLGTYFIVDDTDDFSGLYLDLISHDDARWWQSVRSTATHIEEHWHGDVQPLKDKAQAHHDATILAALEPATPLDDPRVLALVEALKEAERMLKHYGSRDAGGMAQIRAALIALEVNELDEPLHRHTWNPPTNFGSKEE